MSDNKEAKELSVRLLEIVSDLEDAAVHKSHAIAIQACEDSECQHDVTAIASIKEAIAVITTQQASAARPVAWMCYYMGKFGGVTAEKDIAEYLASSKDHFEVIPLYTHQSSGVPADSVADIKWRLEDIRQTLMKRGFNDEPICGMDEWSEPILNLQKAIDKVAALASHTAQEKA